MSDKLDPSLDREFVLQAIFPLLKRERSRILNHRRRAMKSGRAADLRLRDWLSVLRAYSWSCAFCGGPYESIAFLTPLSEGGYLSARNCVPCCLQCNQERDRSRMVQDNVAKKSAAIAEALPL